jgi:polysaccharide export outer membrane protein
MRQAREIRHGRLLRALGAALCLALLSGCGGFLPKDGPTGFEVRDQAEVTVQDGGRLSYALVRLSPLVLSTIQTEPQPPILFSRISEIVPPAQGRVTASDTLSLSIFEAAAGGLFIPPEAGARPGNFVQIPPQEIDPNGYINVPFAGQIRAVGRTPREIEADIVNKLKERAIEPQVIVTIGQRASDSVSVLGDVRASTTIPMRPGGLRLLSALARAGGPAFPAYSSLVTVQRRGRTERALLTSILTDPRQDIQLAQGDVVYVSHEPRIFMAFGAVSNAGTLTFGTSSSTTSVTSGRRFVMDRENMSLAEALATAGGPSSGSADSKGVFLFRYMPRPILERAGVDLTDLPADQIPTVFVVDLSQAEGYFLANHLLMKHNDLIYVSESPATDLIKFLTVVQSVNSTIGGVISNVNGGLATAQALKTLAVPNPK